MASTSRWRERRGPITGGASVGQLKGDEQPPLNHPAPPPLGKGGSGNECVTAPLWQEQLGVGWWNSVAVYRQQDEPTL